VPTRPRYLPSTIIYRLRARTHTRATLATTQGYSKRLRLRVSLLRGRNSDFKLPTSFQSGQLQEQAISFISKRIHKSLFRDHTPDAQGAPGLRRHSAGRHTHTGPLYNAPAVCAPRIFEPSLVSCLRPKHARQRRARDTSSHTTYCRPPDSFSAAPSGSATSDIYTRSTLRAFASRYVCPPAARDTSDCNRAGYCITHARLSTARLKPAHSAKFAQHP
jgi:hypothetical protein